MEMINGSCRFGLWYVHVWWRGDMIFRIRFSKTSLEGPVHPKIVKYLAGRDDDLSTLHSIGTEPDYQYSHIYREVMKINYGETATYGEVAGNTDTSPRLVGLALKRNPTPLVIPCHRVISISGIGGFTPSIDIKESLLRLEKKNKRRLIE